ncbi:HD domain-containing protein [Patescibacteria group bacterium]|nr:HD domain-containing protein [Patescibacteria group bacterium]MBU1921754.1 HD domain-containing protein [Patescibacteria group bacterium]
MRDKQQKLLDFTEKKVKTLFQDFPVPAHGIDHVKRVVKWIRKIARQEKQDVFLAELAALLHDIGRVAEHRSKSGKMRHHELSYILAKQWFKKYKVFDILTSQQKTRLLYAIRYHWNDKAEKYILADILRDADKLDTFGKIGVQRAKDFYQDKDLVRKRVKFQLKTAGHIKTKAAKKIIRQKNLLAPLKKYLAER